jgi:pimeloyl-ACP methyl ester carboxylesterase
MQYFELLLFISSSIYVLFSIKINTSLSKRMLFGILGSMLLLHLIFEGFRWQMIPIYLIWVLAILSVRRYKTNASRSVGSLLKMVLVIFLMLPGIALPFLFPVFDLPIPSGDYTVGTKDLVLQLDRAEVITRNPHDKREIAIKVFYPSNKTEGIKDPYIDQGGRHGFALKYGLPKGAFNYLDKVDTHVFRNAEIARETFPVLIFSHGYNSKANGYYAILSELASQGYVIFSLNHSYESTGSTLSGGKEIYFDYEYAQSIEKDTWQKMEPVVEAFKMDLPFEQRHPIVKKGLTSYFVKDMVERWATDISDVVTELSSMNEEGFFKNRLDTNSIGVFGHSRGGGAAGHALLKDPRIKAGANLDGVQWGDIVNTSFEQPFLFISADWPEEKEDLNSHAYVHKSKSVFYDARILNTGHSNFMDIPLMIPFRSLSEAGAIDPRKGLKITGEAVTFFFDTHLQNKKRDLKRLSDEIQELEISIYSGRGDKGLALYK